MTVVYGQEQDLSVEDYVAVLRETIMRAKRPLENTQRIGKMIAGANFVVTAREHGIILGLARCITDFSWIAYCAELAVKESAQGRGIGRGLLDYIEQALGPQVGLMLVSEETAKGFYERAGMKFQDAAYFRTRLDRS